MARIIDAFTQFFDDAGDPLIDGKLRFLESGTNNTDKDTYKDSGMSIPNSNPVELDGAGRCPSVFGSGVYNIISYTSDNQQIQQFDPVGGDESAGALDAWAGTNIYAKADIVRGSDDEYYRSLTNDNQNNNPTSSPQNWEELEFGRIYNGNITYSATDSVYGADGKLYFSLNNSNTNNNPVTDNGTNWRASDQNPYAVAAGTADAMTADFSPNLVLSDGMQFTVIALGENTAVDPTIAIDGLAAVDIVKLGNQALDKGDIFGAGHVLKFAYRLANNNVELLNPAKSFGLTKDYLHIQDQRTSGTSGGSFASGDWRTRGLNTVLTNNIPGASLSSNIITLPAGAYLIEALAQAYRVNSNKLSIQDDSDDSILLVGSTEFCATGAGQNDGVNSYIRGIITLGSETDIKLAHRSSATSSNGFGNSSGFGVVEVYADIQCWKVG